MERNVLCVKWGDKFSAEHVNRLYRMVQKNTSVPFSFYCLTEDPTGLECSVIPLPNLQLEKWWWKICLFQNNIVQGKTNLYFDLDVVIQNNIDDLFNVSKKLKLIDFSHLDVDTPLPINSSIMAWENNSLQWIYDKFIQDKDYYTKYYSGLDTFLLHDIQDFTGWDDTVYYSRIKGNYSDKPNDGWVKHGDGYFGVWYYPEKKVCIFNQSHEPKFYKGFEKYFL